MFSVLKVAKLNANARLYLWYRLINSLWFIEATWYFYWGRFLSYDQVGVVFAWLVVLGILAEIPTGVVADKWGRKFSVIVGTILLAGGGVVNSLTQSGWELVVGTSLMSIGRAFISGALEAMVYDSMKRDGQEKEWDKLLSTRIQLSLIAYSVAVPLGGYLYTYFFRLPNILETMVLVLSIYLATRFTETQAEGRSVGGLSWKDYVAGFKQLTSVRMWPFLLTSLLIITTYELYDWGLSKPAMAVSFGFGSRGQSLIYTLLAMFNVGVVSTLPYWRRKLGDSLGLLVLNIVSGGAFLASTYVLGYPGIITMLLIEATGNLGEPWTSAVVNANTVSKYRATTISTLAFLAQIPHFFVNILAGSAIEGAGIGVFHRSLGMTIIGVALVGWLARKRPI